MGELKCVDHIPQVRLKHDKSSGRKGMGSMHPERTNADAFPRESAPCAQGCRNTRTLRSPSLISPANPHVVVVDVPTTELRYWHADEGILLPSQRVGKSSWSLSATPDPPQEVRAARTTKHGVIYRKGTLRESPDG